MKLESNKSNLFPKQQTHPSFLRMRAESVDAQDEVAYCLALCIRPRMPTAEGTGITRLILSGSHTWHDMIRCNQPNIKWLGPANHSCLASVLEVGSIPHLDNID